MKTLSVVMPNYNDSDHIGISLTAICEQSFVPKEVIVVDDGSTDKSVTVIEEFAKKYPFIKLVRNEINCGISFSINRAISLATGDYIYSASANDLVLPGLFEKSMNLLMKFPDAGLCCAEGRSINVETGLYYDEIDSRWLSSAGYLPPEKLAAITRTRLRPYPGTCSCIYRRDVLPQGLIYLPEVEWYADWFLHQVIVFRHGCCFIPEPLVLMRWLGSAGWYRGVNDPVRYRKVFIEIIKLLASIEYEDVAKLIIRGRSLRFIKPSIRSPLAIITALKAVKVKNSQAKALFSHFAIEFVASQLDIFYVDFVLPSAQFARRNLVIVFWRVKNLYDQLYARAFHNYDKLRSFVLRTK